MELHFCVFILAAFNSLRGLSAQDVVTYSSKQMEQLECPLSGSTAVQWSDVGETTLTLCSYDTSSEVITRDTNDTKYTNFNCSASETNFDLIIKIVEKDDGGRYLCSRFRGSSVEYTLTVEALPDPFTLTCSKTPLYTCGGPADEELASSLDCTCIATEVSPENLQLQWSILPSAVLQNVTEHAGDYFNLISEVTVMPTTSERTVTCSVTGYQSEGIDSNLIRKSYSFVSPTCTLEVVNLDDMCSKAELYCECSGGMPDAYTYSFYSGNNSRIGDAGDEERREVNIVADETFTFYCRGCNGVSGASSLGSIDYKCTPAKSTKPPDPPKTEDPSGPPKPDPPKGLVIGLSVVGSLIAVAVIVIIIIFVLKREKNPTERKNLATSGGNTNPSYTESAYDEVHKDTLAAKSDKTDGNGMPMSEAPEYAAVDKPLNSEPKPAPRSSQPPPNNSTEKQELQYADIDHSSRTPSNQIRQPAEAPTEYATVQSVIV